MLGSQINSRLTVSLVLSLVEYFQKGIFSREPFIWSLVILRVVYFFNWHKHLLDFGNSAEKWVVSQQRYRNFRDYFLTLFRKRSSSTERDLCLIPGFDVTIGKPLNPPLPFFPYWYNGNSMQEYPGRLVSLMCSEIIRWVSVEEEKMLLLLILMQSFIWWRAHERDNLNLIVLLQWDEWFLLIISSLSPHKN